MKRGKTYYSNLPESFLSDSELELIENKNNFTDELPAELEQNGPETINGIISNSLFVKVRKEPSLESEVLETMRSGDKVRILGSVGDFYKVSTSVNKVAYIYSDFLKEERI